MPFHRLTVPSYNGGLPAGYDYINNALSGTPAPANGVLTAGPNIGSYFVGFGDDGTSANANRPNLAIAQNTDYLDNLLHQDLAVPAVSSTITSAGDTTFVTPSTPSTFVGVPGTPNTPAGILSFAKILDPNGDEIVVSGVAVQVSSITGATVGTGFASGAVTFHFSATIPASQQYRIWYAVRSNLANLPVDALTNITIRTTQELPAAFEDFTKQIATFAGINVTSIVGTLFQTPDGTRLGKAGHMDFAVDPDGSIGVGNRQYRFAGGNTPIYYLQINDVVNFTGTLGNITRSSGMLDFFTGTWLAGDFNTSSYSTIAPYYGYVTMSSTANNGGGILKWEQRLTATDVTNGVDPTMIAHTNSRWSCTVGDGTVSYGDFTGPSGIYKALQFAANHGITNGRILVKRGNYVIDGSTNPLLTTPSSSIFVIEGEAIGGVVINGSASSGFVALLTMGGSSILDLRNIIFSYSSGSSIKAIDFTNASLFMTNVLVEGYEIYADRTVIPGGYANSFYAKNCYFTAVGNANTGIPTVNLQVLAGSGEQLSGIVFEDCNLVSNTSQPICLIQAANTLSGVTTVTGLKFIRCTMKPGYATTSGSNFTGAPGVLVVDPNGMTNSGTNYLYLRDVAFLDCKVIANTNPGSGSDVLMHLIPCTNGTATPTSFAAIGEVRIEGGRWELGDNLQTYNGFFVACRRLVMKNVKFRSCLNLVGGPTQDMKNTLLGNGTTFTWTDSSSVVTTESQNWASFVFAPGASATVDPPFASMPTPAGCIIEGVTIRNLPRDGIGGDCLLMPAANGNEVKGLKLTGYSDTSLGGSLPRYRMWVLAPAGGAGGYIAGLDLKGTDSASGHFWTTQAGNAGEHSGIFITTPNGRLVIKDSRVSGFTVNGSANSGSLGWVLPIPVGATSVYSPAGLTGDGVEIVGNQVGFGCTTSSATHPVFTFLLTNCHISSAYSHGILIAPDHTGIGNKASVQSCTVDGSNVSSGIKILGTWDGITAPPYDTLLVENNQVFGTYADQIEYVVSGSNEPTGVISGNDLASANLRMLPGGSPPTIFSGVRMTETGYSGTSTAMTSTRVWSNTFGCLFNNAFMKTT